MPIVRVGLLDSGVGAELLPHVIHARRFIAGDQGRVADAPLAADRVGHGTVVARTLLGHVGHASVEFVVAQAFGESMQVAAEVVAAGLAWLVTQDVALVCLSFGVRVDEPGLAAGTDTALSRGIVLVAAAPARGGPVYPAAYPGVIAVCGDARCGPDDVSELGGEPADYGACPRPAGGRLGRALGGASCAAAHVAGLLAGFFSGRAPGDASSAREYLCRAARYRGRERRSM